MRASLTAATRGHAGLPDGPVDLLITGSSVHALDSAGTVAEALAVGAVALGTAVHADPVMAW